MAEPQGAADHPLTLPFVHPGSWAGMSQCSVLQEFTQGHALCVCKALGSGTTLSSCVLLLP